MRRLLRLLVLLVIVAGCSRPSGPVEIPEEDLPFSVTRTDSPAETPRAERTYPVYFVQDGRLHEARRELKAEADPTADVLRALLEGPDAGEKELGVTTEIPGEVRLLDVDVAAEAARVDLSGEFQQPALPEVITLRVAQVVWTLTAIAEVGSVSFAIDGEAVAVTTDEGEAVQRRVSREDYSSVSPR